MQHQYYNINIEIEITVKTSETRNSFSDTTKWWAKRGSLSYGSLFRLLMLKLCDWVCTHRYIDCGFIGCMLYYDGWSCGIFYVDRDALYLERHACTHCCLNAHSCTQFWIAWRCIGCQMHYALCLLFLSFQWVQIEIYTSVAMWQWTMHGTSSCWVRERMSCFISFCSNFYFNVVIFGFLHQYLYYHRSLMTGF